LNRDLLVAHTGEALALVLSQPDTLHPCGLLALRAKQLLVCLISRALKLARTYLCLHFAKWPIPKGQLVLSFPEFRSVVSFKKL